MKKKLLSVMLTAALSATGFVIPASAESADDFISITYAPQNYVLRYGGQYSHTGRTELAVNRIGEKPDGSTAALRSDQDDYFSQYKIAAPDAIKSVKINIKNVPIGSREVTEKDSEGNEVVKTYNKTQFSIRYSTAKSELPADGVYYIKDDSTAVGGTAEDVNALLNTWTRKLFNDVNNNPYLIENIDAETFGITDEMTETGKKYDVSKDVTDVVLQSLKDGKTVDGTTNFEVMFGWPAEYGMWGKSKGFGANPSENWAKTTTLDVTYDTKKIADDINTAATADELKAKVMTYASMFGYSEDDFVEKVLNDKIGAYVGTTFTIDSFKALLKELAWVDNATFQLDISDKFNYSNWGKLGEEITTDSFVTYAGNFNFAENGSTVDTFTLNAVDVSSGEAVANGDVIDFYFNPETYSVNVNNLYNAGRGNAFSFDGFAGYAKRIYFAMTAEGSHYIDVAPVVSYTDGTKETKSFRVVNVGQRDWDTTTGYSGSMEIGKTALGCRTWAQTVKSAETNDNGYYTVAGASSSGGISFYAIDVNPEKKIANISFVNNAGNSMNVFAIGGTAMSNAELQAAVSDAEKITTITADNFSTVVTAKNYAKELIDRNVAIESDFAALNALYEQAEWYLQAKDSEQNMIDISDKLNMDMLAPVGSHVAEAWQDGFNSTKAECWTSTPTNFDNRIGTSTYANGVRSVDEYVYTLNDDGETYSFVKSGKTIDFVTPEDRLQAGVKDAIYLKGIAQGGESVTVAASGERMNKLYIMWDAPGVSQRPSVQVNYADGTSETIQVYVGGPDWTIASGSLLNKRTYPNLAGAVWLGYANHSAVKANESDEYYTVTQNGNKYGAINVFGIDLDPTKKVSSYVLIPDANYVTAVYAMTEVSMTNDEMKAVIKEASNLAYVSTEADAELVRKAAVYADELNARHAVKAEDNAWIAKLVEQAAAQEKIYADISTLADSDLMISTKDGENTRGENYSGRDDFLYADMPESVTLAKPGDSGYSDPETGETFKLINTANGNDSVKIEKEGTGAEFDMGSKMIKHVSFLADCIDYVNNQTGATVTAVVNYTDGTTEEVTSKITRGDTWYAGQYYANVLIKYAHYDEATNSYVLGALTDRPDLTGSYITAFGFDIPAVKTVKSIELKSAENYTYYVLAETVTPYTNDELVEKLGAFMDLGVVDIDGVTAENAAEVIKGVNVIEELYKRNYSEIDLDTLNEYILIREKAESFNTPADVLKFTPDIELGTNTVKATLKMVNTTASDKPYVLIIAAYDANNQLVGVSATEQKTLKSMTYSDTDSVEINIPANAASYKAMVWETIAGMVPIAVIGK